MNIYVLGISLMIAFTVLSAGYQNTCLVLIQSGFLTISLLLFFPFLISVPVFNVLNKIFRWQYYDKDAFNQYTKKEHIKYIIFINISTAVAWGTGVAALMFIDSTTMLSASLLIGSLVTYFISSREERRQTRNFELFFAILAFNAFPLLFFCYWFGISSPQEKGIKFCSGNLGLAIIIGFTLCLIEGIAIAYSTTFIKKLSPMGWKPNGIVATRFFLLIIVSGITSFVFFLEPSQTLTQNSGYQPTFNQTLLILLLCSFGGVIIPYYCLQYGMKMLNNKFIISFCLNTYPVTGLLGQVFVHYLVVVGVLAINFSVKLASEVILIVVVSFILSAIPIIRGYIEARNNQNQPQQNTQFAKRYSVLIFGMAYLAIGIILIYFTHKS